MRFSRFVSIIIIVALIFCNTSYIFANSNVHVTNTGTSYYLGTHDSIQSGTDQEIGGLLSGILRGILEVAQRIGPRTTDGSYTVNSQLENLRSMAYSIMQNVINYLGPVTTPSGSKALNELSYMIWSAITALGTSVDGTYTNSSLILAQEQATNTSLSSILSQDTTQTSHLAYIRTTASSIRDELKKVNWHVLSSTFDGISNDGINYSLVSSVRGNNLSARINANLYTSRNYIVHVKIPTGSYYPPICTISLNTNQISSVIDIPYMNYFVALNNTDIFFLTNNGANIYNIIVNYNDVSTLVCNISDDSYVVEYLSPNDKDYFIIYDFLVKQNQMVAINQLVGNTSGLSSLGSGINSIIDILDNSTSIVQNDTEVNINTNLSIDDVNFFNSGSRRFKLFFDTGITAAAFGLALDTYSYDQFFHQEVTDLVQTVNNQYTEVPLVINTWPII